MKFSITTKTISQANHDALIIPLFEDRITDHEKDTDKLLANKISKLRKTKDFTGETGQICMIFEEDRRVILLGMGKSLDINQEKLRVIISAAVNSLKTLPIKSVFILPPNLPDKSSEEIGQTIVETFIISDYKFTHYKTSERKKLEIESVQIFAKNNQQKKELESGLALGKIIGEAVNMVRDLGNHPANIATPIHLAEHAKKITKQHAKDLKIEILNRAEIKKERMEAVLAVGQGSIQEPRFIIMKYQKLKTAPTIVLIGKGLTFDSGGISIKPAEKMEEMKYDMTGAATVIGIMDAVAGMKLPINLIGLMASVENLPSGSAIRPGDIIKSRSGKTIEVINTDAEGRLTLADVLDYAKEFKPDLVIDLATLTGSIVVALGDDIIGGFTNQQKYMDELKKASLTSGEKLWQMPMDKDYESFLKSDFADIRNQSFVRYGDAIHAANFLQNFVSYPWIHLDIAGVAWTTREKPYRPKGATATGLRLVVEFLKNYRK